MNEGEIYVVREIRDGMYIYSDNGAGGWPWNEFTVQGTSQPGSTARGDQ
jgi:hypothetical protein